MKICNNNQDKVEKEKLTRLVDEITSPFDTNLVSSPHAFILDKDECNQFEDIAEPIAGSVSLKRKLPQAK